MENLFGLVFSLVPLGVIAAFVYVVYVVVQRSRTSRLETADPGIGTLRRLYFYIISFVALMMAGNGLVQVLQYVLEGLSGDVVSPSQTRLAVGGSLMIVGIPLWLVHWLLVQRQVKRLPVETRSLARKLFVYAVLGVAIGFVMATAVSLLHWIFGLSSFSGFPLAAIIIWGGVWAFHWRTEKAEGQPTPETLGIRRLYIYLVSLVSLTMLVVGSGIAIHIVLLEGYESLASLSVLVPEQVGLWRETMRKALAAALVGGAVWGVHWLSFARTDRGSLLRQIYLNVFAVMGGVVTILVSVGIILNGGMEWLLGVPWDGTTAERFRFLPGALASLSVGIGLSAYHWTVVRGEADFSDDEPEALGGSYPYVLAALGLVALVTGIHALVNGAISIFIESSRDLVVGEEVWRKPIALSATLGILGIPLWGYFWRTAQLQVAATGSEARALLARRIFIFGVLGVGMLALVGSASGLIFVFLRDVLGDGLGTDSLRDAKVPLGFIVAAAVFVPYYWTVYRQDRQAEPEGVLDTVEPRVQKEVTVLVSEGGDAFVRSLEAALGYRVSILRRADPMADLPELGDAEYDELVQRVVDAAGRNVLVVPGGRAVSVMSYE